MTDTNEKTVGDGQHNTPPRIDSSSSLGLQQGLSTTDCDSWPPYDGGGKK